jgi:phosphoribosylformylglycinamidine (FGAM) synthase-like enzyme/phosphoribosylformylglycinamidine (FGAM) synthase PurS component
MTNKIEVAMKPGWPDPAGLGLRGRLAEDLGIAVDDVRVIDVYTLNADLAPEELERVCVELFTDPIIQESAINRSLARDYKYLIEVGFLPGVTDNVGKSSAEGIADTLGRPLKPGEGVYKSTQYAVRGAVSKKTCERIARDALANELIQRWVVKSPAEMKKLGGKPLLGLPIVTQRSDPEVKPINLEIPGDQLVALSREMTLALELHELKAIQAYYRDPKVRTRRAGAGLPPGPTDIELECLAQTWSEHCKHKIFNAEIEYTDEKGETRTIDSVFKTYVKATTDEVGKTIDWLVSVFHDNAGIIRFDDNWNFALKVETHNSPSALDPYGGAITGIVGVNRDVLGAGMGCRCILNTDVFCFASPFYDGEIPARLFHPRRVLRGVHQGVKDGGNQSGIPDVNGAIVFHERFLGKPLVFCGTGGMIPATVAGKPSHEKRAMPGDLIVMTGGRIGKDGIHGATFSSEELHAGSPATAVQIGDPITQKKMADFLIEARDLGLFTFIQDDGAGGLSSSIGEMACGSGGCEVHLEKAPLKYAGLAPWEIFLSEAQERMTLSVPPARIDAFMGLARRREVEATVLGRFTDSGRLECYYDGKLIASLDMDFLHDGVPKMHLRAVTPMARTTLFSMIESNPDVLKLIDSRIARFYLVVPIAVEDNVVVVASCNRDDFEFTYCVSDLEQILGRTVRVVLAYYVDIRAAQDKFYGPEPDRDEKGLVEIGECEIEFDEPEPDEMCAVETDECAFEYDGSGFELVRPVPLTGRDLQGSLAEGLKAVLGSLNVCSKETFVRMYDHEVQAQSVLKQFQGVHRDGPGDAAVLRPVPGSNRGLAISCGICPKYSYLDTYWMTAAAVDEAVRNLICVGAKLGTVAGLDNFCWPDPIQSKKTPDGEYKLAQLVRCCEALRDVCVAYGIPLISGKDSMKNDYKIGNTKISIPPTVLFTAAAVMDDVTKAVSMDVKRPDDVVYLLGGTYDEMGGSEYMALRGEYVGHVPRVNTAAARALYNALSSAIASGWVASCHDCSDGGLGVALAESAFAGGYGMDLDIRGIPVENAVVALFSESQSRFVVTVHPKSVSAFEDTLSGCPVTRLGTVIASEEFRLIGHDGAAIRASLSELKEAWQRPLRW